MEDNGTIKGDWHWGLGFCRGFGWFNQVNQEKTIWIRDTSEFLGITNLVDEDLDEIYLKLQPFLAERAEKIRKYFENRPPVQFTKITIRHRT